MDPVLKACLQPLMRRHRWCRFWIRLTWVWFGAAGIGVGLWMALRWTGWAPQGVWPALSLAGALVLTLLHFRRRWQPDLRGIARDLERRHPEFQGRLLTAVEQEPRADGEFNYLQDRLVTEVLRSGQVGNWVKAVPRARLLLAPALNATALLLFAGMIWVLSTTEPPVVRKVVTRLISGVEITPGDTELEKGQSLVVMAEYGGSVPTQAALVITPATGLEQRIPMVRSLSQRMFGVTVPGVSGDLSYRIESDEHRSRDFRVKVFELPRLEKADVDLVYPEYTGRAPRRVEDTRRVSAVEGTKLTVSLVLNKSVTSARLVPREGETVELEPDSASPAARLTDYALQVGGTYALVLTDAEGRTNRVPPQFVFDVLENRLPELRFARPKGDVSPSALEEVHFEASVFDDFGVLAYGLGWERIGGEPQWLRLGEQVPGGEKRTFTHLLALEGAGVEPDDLMVWYLWAEDLGPDGQPRRHTSDLYFAEIRPFEQVFREGESSAGQSEQASEQAGQQGQQSPSQQLAELQKEIINATWNVRRDHRRVTQDYTEAVQVIADSQAAALAQAGTAQGEAGDPRATALWTRVTEAMDEAVSRLEAGLESVDGLAAALSSEQSAYQALLQLRERESQVSRRQGQQSSQRGSQGQQAMQRQLDQLELTQSENRYETERQALDSGGEEQQAQLQVLSRLKELAQRQQDLNERLQELQTALQAAENEAERERIRRELKRLQDEEQQMLADLDELMQRMERQTNQANLAEQRQQMEQTREAMQRVAEATQQGQVSQALAEGTRAQRQMESMRDSLRQETSSAFAEDLQRMRSEARELVRRQEDIQEEIDSLQNPDRKVLSDSEVRDELYDQLSEQQGRVQDLVKASTRVSADAEVAEPLVARELYDALREYAQDEASHTDALREELIDRGMMTVEILRSLQAVENQDAGQSLELTEEMLRAGYLPLADQTEARAREGIGVLSRGVERAAERVLGDDTEALRRAREQLASASAELEREMAQARQAETSESEGGGAQREGGDETRDGASGSASLPEGQDLGSAEEQGPEQRENASARAGQGGGRDEEADREGRGRAADELNLEQLLSGESRDRSGGGYGGTGPITGGDFEPWSDQLREAEELLDLPELRDLVTSARERARAIRREFRRTQQKPDWAVVALDVAGPLLEVREELAKELARREPGDRLAPIDRDPVPGPYLELVRQYYEDLGKGD